MKALERLKEPLLQTKKKKERKKNCTMLPTQFKTSKHFCVYKTPCHTHTLVK